MKIVEVPIVVSNTEGQGTRRGSVAARGVGGATDRDSLSTREANGATMLMEEDTAAVTKRERERERELGKATRKREQRHLRRLSSYRASSYPRGRSRLHDPSQCQYAAFKRWYCR